MSGILLSSDDEIFKKKLMMAGICAAIIIGIVALIWIGLYLMYYKYSLLTGSEKTPYTLTTSTNSSSYIDESGNTIACIWPVGSIEYRPNDAKVAQMEPAKLNPQYLPAVTDGQWPTTLTYSLLYSNVFGPYLTASPHMVTQTVNGKSIHLSYPIGTPVTATINSKLNLICLFQGKGNVIVEQASDASTDHTVSAKRRADATNPEDLIHDIY